jgi:hypothetical protein
MLQQGDVVLSIARMGHDAIPVATTPGDTKAEKVAEQALSLLASSSVTVHLMTTSCPLGERVPTCEELSSAVGSISFHALQLLAEQVQSEIDRRVSATTATE